MNKINFEDLPSTLTLIDATNLNLLQDNVETETNKKINYVILLSVDSTAPSECSLGDKYYNTLNELIYTSTGTDTWGTVGTSPIEECLYIDLEHHALYYYDGTDFICHGAATTDSLNNDGVNPPSVDAVNDALEVINNNIGDVTELETTATDLTSAINELESRKPILLWTNPSPTQSFIGQPITLSSSDYDYIEVYFYDWVDSRYMKSVKALKGEKITLDNVMSNNNGEFYLSYRYLTYVSATSYTAETCKALYGKTSMQVADPMNYLCIPVKIYGYKY